MSWDLTPTSLAGIMKLKSARFGEAVEPWGRSSILGGSISSFTLLGNYSVSPNNAEHVARMII